MAWGARNYQLPSPQPLPRPSNLAAAARAATSEPTNNKRRSAIYQERINLEFRQWSPELGDPSQKKIATDLIAAYDSQQEENSKIRKKNLVTKFANAIKMNQEAETALQKWALCVNHIGKREVLDRVFEGFKVEQKSTGKALHVSDSLLRLVQ